MMVLVGQSFSRKLPEGSPLSILALISVAHWDKGRDKNQTNHSYLARCRSRRLLGLSGIAKLQRAVFLNCLGDLQIHGPTIDIAPTKNDSRLAIATVLDPAGSFAPIHLHPPLPVQPESASVGSRQRRVLSSTLTPPSHLHTATRVFDLSSLEESPGSSTPRQRAPEKLPHYHRTTDRPL
ncbi:hypothetical protein VTH06DRAFT_7749 [Thermothelomyces fergusii]